MHYSHNEDDHNKMTMAISTTKSTVITVTTNRRMTTRMTTRTMIKKTTIMMMTMTIKINTTKLRTVVYGDDDKDANSPNGNYG